MPTPRLLCYESPLPIGVRRRLGMDAALPEGTQSAYEDLMVLLRQKLADTDYATAEGLIRHLFDGTSNSDVGVAQDRSLNQRVAAPRLTGNSKAQAAFAARFPNAARVRVVY